MSENDQVERHEFPAATALPLLVYRGALPRQRAEDADACERLFARNGWTGAWHNGIYGYHHFHATTPEVLGIARGSAKVRFGGPDGALVEVAAGDVVVIPAGVSHCNEGASRDLLVVGAYPDGHEPDIRRGTPQEDTGAPARIAKVPVPDSDPVFGADGPLPRHWRG